MANEAEQESPGRSLGRNDRCHCDSGKKYKQCCLAADEAAARDARAKQAEAVEAEAPEAPAEEDEAAGRRPKSRRDKTHQPWKRDQGNAAGAQKRTLPRKVGS